MTLPNRRWLPLLAVATAPLFALAASPPLAVTGGAGDAPAPGTGTATLTNTASSTVLLAAVDPFGPLTLPSPVAGRTMQPGERLQVPLSWGTATVVQPALVVRTGTSAWVLSLGGSPGADLGASPADDPAFPVAAADAYERECCSTAPPPVVEMPADPELTAQATQLRYCYSRELKKDHALAGAAQFTLSVGAGGRVSSLRLDATTLPHGAVESCVAGLLARTPLQHRSGTATLSFTFRPGG